jgi:hypothetical protein
VLRCERRALVAIDQKRNHELAEHGKT